MKKFLDLSSWSRWSLSLSKGAVIGFMLIMAFAFVGCDDSSSASAGQNDEPGVESSSSSSGKVTEPDEVTSSSSEKAKSSSSVTQSDVKQSSSSEKTGKSSSSVDDVSSSTVKSESSSSVEIPKSSSSGLSESSSSSADKEVSSSSSEIGCKTETEDNCEYGELIDDRDGQTYKTVKIGDQWWMAENLNYETDNSFCYNDSAEYCEKYGRLYTWAAATDSAGVWGENGKGCGYAKHCTTAYPVRGVCPEGWHLPTKNEWNTLSTAVGGQTTPGKVLKSTSGWYTDDVYHGNGTDAFSFSALPAGYRIYTGLYDLAGYYAYFWSSTARDSRNAYNVYLYYNHDYMALDYSDKRRGFSVRCVKDSE